MTGIEVQGSKLLGSAPHFAALPSLVEFWALNNLLTGSLPALSGNPALSLFFCGTNELTGSFPDLSGNPVLKMLSLERNGFTGAIPDLSGSTKLIRFYCYSNELTDFNGSVADLENAIDFRADNQALTELAVNNLLVAFDNSASVPGKINLTGLTIGTPTGVGAAAKASLIAKGWTVRTR